MIRRSVAAVVATAIALIFATGASASNGASGQFPVDWELSGATCSQLEPDMTIEGSGTGSFFMTANNNLHVVVTGTATDGNGGFWRFDYAQNARPLGDGAYEVSDHFNLVGSGSPIKLHSHFVIAFTSSDLETAEILYVKQFHGDPEFCDPI
jgi:hypothetical protein